MNKSKLKSYAPQARRDFIAAVTARANLLGLSDSGGNLEVAHGERKGDIAIIAGQEWSAKVYELRERLVQRMKIDGFSHTVEAVAYTWFNRFAALRYMEIHDYLDHGYRALSNREGGMPEILNHATELDLPGLNKDRAVELKLAGDKDGELYKMLLVAQCNALSRSMPFLFEHIDDETELLLPDNLLRTDSVIAKLVASIPEEDWQEVEIIGWLYQFYISEKKDEVIGKVVKSEDIPAATQLFTPNWIVKYLVQNSVGRLWLMANPASMLKSEWAYYIEPAEQTPEVQAQLDALIQTRIQQDSPLTQGEGQGERVGGTLSPETITVLDPACGSGHILVEAYEVLKGIYLERGYRLRDIPRLILEKNLYGLDIDDRAAQLAGFALLMKARADDRRLLDNPPTLNVLALQESSGLNAAQLSAALVDSGQWTVDSKQQLITDICSLITVFEHAKTFGSLIQIPQALNAKLVSMAESLQRVIRSGDLLSESAAQQLLPLVVQAKVLGMQFDAVVANPPYMGSKGMNPVLKEFAMSTFQDSKSDLFAMFMERGFSWCKSTGFNSMVTMQSWMFLSSYEAMREKFLREHTLHSMVHMGNGVMGIAFGTAATVLLSKHVEGYEGSFCYCENGDVNEDGVPQDFPVQNDRLKTAKADDFKKIPGSPVAYWACKIAIDAFSLAKPLKEIINPKQGSSTGDDESYIRFWHEIQNSNIGFGISSLSEALLSGKKYFPIDKGGEFRRWFGNHEKVIRMGGSAYEELLCMGNHLPSRDLYFKAGLTWSKITSGDFTVRFTPTGSVFSSVGLKGFPNQDESLAALAFMNSCVMQYFVSLISPTVSVISGDIEKIPFYIPVGASLLAINDIADKATKISSYDWDLSERSWGFKYGALKNQVQHF